MTNEDIWETLRRGGLTVEVTQTAEGETATRLVGRFNGLDDLAGVERLGGLLAEEVRKVNPDVIVVGEGAKDLVLGFVVARALELPLVRVMASEGLVELAGVLPKNARGAFVADKIRKAGFIYAVNDLLDREGGELAAVVSFVTASEPKLPVAWQGLVRAEDGLQNT